MLIYQCHFHSFFALVIVGTLQLSSRLTVLMSCARGLHSRPNKDKLQKLHNRAGRIITRSGYEIRSTEVLDQLGWQQLEDRWSTNKAMLMFKVVHNLVPSYLSEQFSRRDTAHDHNTRGNHVNLSVPKPNTNFLKNSLACNGAVAWNSMPTDIRYAENIEMFKKKLIL